jgi:hypothetical protein
MTRGIKTAIYVLAIAAMTAAIYVPRLDFAPIYLANDEPRFALQARAIATTGRDLNGKFMPLYFTEVGFSAGRDPIIIYLTDALLELVALF